MLILALDTSSRAGSIALRQDGELVGVFVGDPALTHGRRLPGDVLGLLEAHRVSLSDVDFYAVAAGPGSFTGLRVGIAAVQGFALAHARLVVPVSSLAALAALAGGIDASCALVATVIDADRQEVFAALYRRAASSERDQPDHEHGLVVAPAGFAAVESPVLLPAAALGEHWAQALAGRRTLFLGSGAERYHAELRRLGADHRIVDATPPLAPAIARIAAVQAEAGRAVSPHAIHPVYVRRPDAELARDRRAAAERPGHAS